MCRKLYNSYFIVSNVIHIFYANVKNNTVEVKNCRSVEVKNYYFESLFRLSLKFQNHENVKKGIFN